MQLNEIGSKSLIDESDTKSSEYIENNNKTIELLNRISIDSSQALNIYDIITTNEKYRDIYVYLCFSGLLWPRYDHFVKANDYYSLYKYLFVCAFNLFVRFVTALSFGWYCYILLFENIYLNDLKKVFPGTEVSKKLKFAFIFGGVILLIQIVAIVPTIVEYRARIFSNDPKFQGFLMPFHSEKYLPILLQSLKIAKNYAIVCSILMVLCATILNIADFVPGTEYIGAIAPLAVLTLTFPLSFCLFFLLIDLKMSHLLVQDAIDNIDNKRLTYEIFYRYRKSINNFVTNSYWINYLFIPTCVLNALAVIVTVAYTNSGVAYIFNLSILFCREIFFLVIALVYIAKINDLSSSFMLKLSDSEFSTTTEGIRIYHSSAYQPIAYTILGYSFTRTKLLVQLITYILSVFITILQSVLDSK